MFRSQEAVPKKNATNRVERFALKVRKAILPIICWKKREKIWKAKQQKSQLRILYCLVFIPHYGLIHFLFPLSKNWFVFVCSFAFLDIFFGHQYHVRETPGATKFQQIIPTFSSLISEIRIHKKGQKMCLSISWLYWLILPKFVCCEFQHSIL